MAALEKDTLEEVYKLTDPELAALIRDAIVSFRRQKNHGVESVVSYIFATDEATMMVAIQKNL